MSVITAEQTVPPERDIFTNYTAADLMQICLLVKWEALHWSAKEIREVLRNASFTHEQFKEYSHAVLANRTRLNREMPKHPERVFSLSQGKPFDQFSASYD